MAQPPPAEGGDVPFWSRGDWWQGQPNGSLRRWSSLQEQWVEADLTARVDPEEARRAQRVRRGHWLRHRLPVIIVLLVVVNVASFGIVFAVVGDLSPGGILVLVELAAFAVGINWLLKQP